MMERVKNKKYSGSNSVCVLVSGGLDSCVLLCEMTDKFDDVYPVYVKGGLLWEKAEIYWLWKFISSIKNKSLKKLKIITSGVTDIYKNHWSITGNNVPDHTTDDSAVYLPGRNIILLSKTAVFCSINNIRTISIAPLKTNCFPDGTDKFFRLIQETLGEGLNFKFSIITPFSHLSKTDVIKLGAHLPLELTFSCIKPSGMHHCGVCAKCAERKKAFQQLKIKDKTVYKS